MDGKWCTRHAATASGAYNAGSSENLILNRARRGAGRPITVRLRRCFQLILLTSHLRADYLHRQRLFTPGLSSHFFSELSDNQEIETTLAVRSTSPLPWLQRPVHLLPRSCEVRPLTVYCRDRRCYGSTPKSDNVWQSIA